MNSERPGKQSRLQQLQSSLQGMRAFYVMWFGQFISIFASRMTQFAITLWAWDLTGTATGLILVGVITFLPGVILSPFAGTLIDRWDRKFVMALSDIGAGISTFVLLLLFFTGRAEIWHLYVTGAFSSAFATFQWPAYSAVVTTMVPKEQYARANSMRSVIASASGIAAPLLAGALLTIIDIPSIMIIDLFTLNIAILTLLIIKIPQPMSSKEDDSSQGTIWTETLFGLRYILNRQSLLFIMLLLAVSNIYAGFSYSLIDPMILAKSGDSSVILGFTHSAGSVGFLVGGLLMSVWGGPKKRIHAVNISFIMDGLLGAFILGTTWSTPFWLVGAFLISMTGPIINSAYIAILQAKVAPDLQGRIFGIENTITTLFYPISQLIAAQLADRVFEPGLMIDGRLVGVLSPVFGVGEGAGTGVVIVIGGLIAILTGIAGYAIKPIREIENILPDHELQESTQPA